MKTITATLFVTETYALDLEPPDAMDAETVDDWARGQNLPDSWLRIEVESEEETVEVECWD